MRGVERVGGRVVWLFESEGLHERGVLRGREGEGYLVAWVKEIT